jgi:hypothetical protein
VTDSPEWATAREMREDLREEQRELQEIFKEGFNKGRESRILTVEQAGLLGDLIHGVERGLKLRYYPYGADYSDATMHVQKFELRAFTYEGGVLYPHDKDIRDAHVWCSGIFEHWLKVGDLIIALDNAVTGKAGMDKPMAVIEKD